MAFSELFVLLLT